jgi:hypothetical protein
MQAGGYVLVGVLTIGLLVNLRKDPEHAFGGARIAPLFTVVLATILAGFLALTAERSVADVRVLAAGAGSGLAATALWVFTVVAFPPIPANVASRLIAIGAGMGVPRLPTAAARSNRRSPVAALSTGVIGAPLIVPLVAVLATHGPPSLIPRLAGPRSPPPLAWRRAATRSRTRRRQSSSEAALLVSQRAQPGNARRPGTAHTSGRRGRVPGNDRTAAAPPPVVPPLAAPRPAVTAGERCTRVRTDGGRCSRTVLTRAYSAAG